MWRCFAILVVSFVSSKSLKAPDNASRNSIAQGYLSPIELGGNMSFSFQGQANTRPEPLNVIISAASRLGRVEGDNGTAILNAPRGLSQYLQALNFSDECGGLHLSTPALAAINNATPVLLDFLYRENFGDLVQGTCEQSVKGGHHFRGWLQSTTGAWFLGASLEKSLELQHDLVNNGYDLGRDEIVRRAQIGGKDSFGCHWPPAKIEEDRKLVKRDAGGFKGAYNHDIGIDGVVKVITVQPPICPKNKTREVPIMDDNEPNESPIKGSHTPKQHGSNHSSDLPGSTDSDGQSSASDPHESSTDATGENNLPSTKTGKPKNNTGQNNTGVKRQSASWIVFGIAMIVGLCI